MFEKIKDLFYEISDILLALVIILMMSTVITWKITDSLAFSKDKTSMTHEVKENVQQEPAVNPVDTSNPTAGNSEDTAEGTANDNKDSVEVQDHTVEDTDDTTVTDEQTPTIPSKPAMIHVEIPSGTPGMRIAKILKDKGLIDNTAKFVARIEEKNLSSKLKSGSFDIESGTSLDHIIGIITGTNN